MISSRVSLPSKHCNIVSLHEQRYSLSRIEGNGIMEAAKWVVEAVVAVAGVFGLSKVVPALVERHQVYKERRRVRLSEQLSKLYEPLQIQFSEAQQHVELSADIFQQFVNRIQQLAKDKPNLQPLPALPQWPSGGCSLADTIDLTSVDKLFEKGSHTEIVQFIDQFCDQSDALLEKSCSFMEQGEGVLSMAAHNNKEVSKYATAVNDQFCALEQSDNYLAASIALLKGLYHMLKENLRYADADDLRQFQEFINRWTKCLAIFELKGDTLAEMLQSRLPADYENCARVEQMFALLPDLGRNVERKYLAKTRALTKLGG